VIESFAKLKGDHATSRLTNSRWLLIIVHDHVVGVVAVENFQQFSLTTLAIKSSTAALAGSALI
jgi:hypothetical protein